MASAYVGGSSCHSSRKIMAPTLLLQLLGVAFLRFVIETVLNEMADTQQERLSVPPLTSSSFPEISNQRFNAINPNAIISTSQDSHIAFMTYIQLDDSPERRNRFQSQVIGALETWLENFTYFVVMTNTSRHHLEWQCNEMTTTLCRQIVPLVVDCPDGYYGPPACCKQEQGLLKMFQLYPHFDWYYFGDDDQYMRVDYLRDFVRELPPSENLILTSGPLKRLGKSGFEFEDQDPQGCSPDSSFMYPWGQPIIHSRRALANIAPSLQMGGYTAQCNEFDVTQDVAYGLFHWMHGTPRIELPFAQFGVKSAYHVNCNCWVGAHRIGKDDSGNQYQVHEVIGQLGKKHSPPPYKYKWHNTSAFKSTLTYANFGPISTWTKWHTMPVKDCQGPDHHAPTMDKHEALERLAQRSYDICIVGAGLYGSVLAERFASSFGRSKAILVTEKRPYLGGNCFDFLDKETGIRVSKYGPHFFHTRNEKAWQYIKEFGEWTRYENKELAFVNNTLVPFPVNIETINRLFGTKISNQKEMEQWVQNEQVSYDHDPRNAQEMLMSQVGPRLYRLIFGPLLQKQFGKDPQDLGPEVLTSVPPITYSFDRRYFHDPIQYLPKYGFSAIFREMYRTITKRDDVELHLGIDFLDVKDVLSCAHTFYTGAIDDYFANSGLPPLEYRSINAERQVMFGIGDNTFFQPTLSVIHPSSHVDLNRIVEYKHLDFRFGRKNRNQDSTVIFVERFSNDKKQHHYPVPSHKTMDLYDKYRALASKEKNVYFVGGMANYEYWTLGETVLNALETFDEYDE